MEFSGSVKGGKVELDDKLGWSAALASLNGKRVKVSVERLESRRSTDANRRYWGVLVPLARHFLNMDRVVPLNKDQTHYVLATAFVGSEVTALGVSVPMETHTLSTGQFYEFTTKVEAWLAEHGYCVPQPGERMEAEI